MKKSVAIWTGLAVTAVASLASASQVVAWQLDLGRVQRGVERVAGHVRAVVDAAAAQDALVRTGWRFHPVHGWRRTSTTALPHTPGLAWQRERALAALTKVEDAARQLLRDAARFPFAPKVQRDFRVLEKRFEQALRVFAGLRPTVAMRLQMAAARSALAEVSPTVARLAYPGLYHAAPAPVLQRPW